MTLDHDSITLHGSVWMTVDDRNFGGKGRIALLALIDEYGSITRAAKSFGMSYKAAWDAIDIMNNLSGEPLVERQAGGKGGGGTRLTERGKRLVANFRLIEEEHRRFVAELGEHVTDLADDLLMIRRLSMKTSARNQFFGRIASLTPGAVNDEIVLDIGNGVEVVAIITHGSAESLGLTQGMEAFALIKSSSVILAVDDGQARFSSRNRLPGTVARIQPGAVNSEITVNLSGGGTLTAIITNDSCEHLGITEDAPVTALFKASSVIVCVPN